MGTELVLLSGVLMLKLLGLYRGCSNGRGLFKPADLLGFLGLLVVFADSALKLGLPWIENSTH